jgi:digeranylgeranylglycerophospholipid reductase
MKCDVLVVGASPAGIMAAISAARSGSIVILLEKSLEKLDHPANTLFQGMASRAELEIDSCYVKKTLDGMRIISPGGYSVPIKAKGYFLDRKKFDDYYLNIAEKHGTIVLLDEAVSTKLQNGRRMVRTREEEIDAGVVIDASGVNSTIASQAGLYPMRHPKDIAWAMEAVVEHPGLGEERFFEYWIGSVAPGWKATFSPGGGDLATLGVFVRGYGHNVQPFFRSFLNKFKIYKSLDYRNIEDMKILSVRRGGDPIATIPRELVTDAMMVTGGAAGQSGLAYSMRAGSICGSVASEAADARDLSRERLSEYRHLWNAEFRWEYRTGRACLETLRKMSDTEIDDLARGLAGRDLISDGSFFRKLLAAGAITAAVKPRAVSSLLKNMLSS